MKHFFRALGLLENTLAVTAFGLISATAFANVMARYVFNASLAFTSELTVNLAVLLTMVGAAIGIREGSHLGFTLLKDMSIGRKHQLLVMLGGAAIVLFYLVLIKFGMDVSLRQLDRNQSTPALGLPMWLLSLSLPLGGALGIIRTVQTTITAFKDSPMSPVVHEEGGLERA